MFSLFTAFYTITFDCFLSFLKLQTKYLFVFCLLKTGKIYWKTALCAQENCDSCSGIGSLLLVFPHWPAGLLSSGVGIGPMAVEELQAVCCSVLQRQTAAPLVEHIEVSRQAAQLHEARLEHMVASETQEGSQQSGLPHARHHSSGRSKDYTLQSCSVFLCPHLFTATGRLPASSYSLTVV